MANEGDGEGEIQLEGEPGEGGVDGEGEGNAEGQPPEGMNEGEGQEGLSEGEEPTDGTSEGALDGDGEDTGCAFTFDSSLSQPKSRSANPGVWLPLLAACVLLRARGRFARR